MPTSKPTSEYSDSVYSYLGSVQRGRDADLRTPLYGGIDRDIIADNLWNVISEVELPTPLLELEVNERKKIGPYSIMLPWSERRSDLDAYFNNPQSAPMDTPFIKAISRVASLVRAGSLSPISLDQSYESSTKSTNWGLPYFSKGNKRYLSLARQGIEAQMDYPSVVGWRGQPNGTDKPKQRIVWMYPHSISLHEQKYLTPLVNATRDLPEFSFTSLSIIRDEVHSWLINAVANGYTMWSFDASSYDQSISRQLIKAAFSVIKFWFGDRTRRSEIELDLLEEYFSTSGILTPDGVLSGRNGSVPSGSGFTNIVDSIVNLIIHYYISERLGLDIVNIKVQGDDAIVIYTNPVEISALQEVADELGIIVNPQKNIISNDRIMFLQDIYLEGLRGARSIMRVVNGAISYERMVTGWNKWMDVIRWLSQADNASEHPMFHELIDYIYKGDKYQLGCNLRNANALYREAGGIVKVEETLRVAAFRGPGKTLPTSDSPSIRYLKSRGCYGSNLSEVSELRSN